MRKFYFFRVGSLGTNRGEISFASSCWSWWPQTRHLPTGEMVFTWPWLPHLRSHSTAGASKWGKHMFCGLQAFQLLFAMHVTLRGFFFFAYTFFVSFSFRFLFVMCLYVYMLAPPNLPLQVLGCEHQNTKIQQHDCGSEEPAKLLDCAGWLDYFRALYTPELRPHLICWRVISQTPNDRTWNPSSNWWNWVNLLWDKKFERGSRHLREHSWQMMMTMNNRKQIKFILYSHYSIHTVHISCTITKIIIMFVCLIRGFFCVILIDCNFDIWIELFIPVLLTITNTIYPPRESRGGWCVFYENSVQYRQVICIIIFFYISQCSVP